MVCETLHDPAAIGAEILVGEGLIEHAERAGRPADEADGAGRDEQLGLQGAAVPGTMLELQARGSAGWPTVACSAETRPAIGARMT